MGQQRNGRTVGNGGGMRKVMDMEEALLIGVIIGAMMAIVIILPLVEMFA